MKRIRRRRRRGECQKQTRTHNIIDAFEEFLFALKIKKRFQALLESRIVDLCMEIATVNTIS